jgi:sugar/nucleoside kinase (ribokinase family)
MKQYDVYALGNALVDIEYHCKPAKLASMEIEKGVMTLIDEHRHNHLVDFLGADHEAMASGGSAANSLIALAQLGGRASFTCRVGNDMTGQFFIKDLKAAGVHTNADAHLAHGEITGKCLVFVTPDADRTMNTFLGASTSLDREQVCADTLADAAWVYLEGYLVSDERTRAAAIRARELAVEHGTQTALTLSDPNMLRFFRDGMLELIGPGIELLFANEDEVFELTGTRDPDAYIDTLSPYARKFAVTRGAEGAVVFDGETLEQVPAPGVNAIDTLGAGDMFAGAFLYGLTHGYGYHDAGRLAALAASEIVTHFGPRLPLETTQAVMRRFNSGNI